MFMSQPHPEKSKSLYLYDLPKDTTNSNQIAMIIKEKTGYVLEVKPQIHRQLTRPFCSAVIYIPDNEAFQKACKEMKYFVYDGKMCRALPYDTQLSGANAQRLVDHNVFFAKIPKDGEHNCQWLDSFCSQYGEIISLKVSLNPDHSSRGYGFACFQDPAAAAKCLAANDTKESV